MLFRSSSGYCSSCEAYIQQKKIHEEKARAAQSVQPVKSNPPVKKEKEQGLEQTQAPKFSENALGKHYLCANTDQTISADMIPPVFDMHDITHEGQGYS